jgi:CheY-like chemotaxis protein
VALQPARPAPKPFPVTEPATENDIFLAPDVEEAELQPATQPEPQVELELEQPVELMQPIELEPASSSSLEEKPFSVPVIAEPASGPVLPSLPPAAKKETDFEFPSTGSLVPGDHSIILAIDQDPQVAELYRRYLANQPFSIVAITNLEEAVTVARNVQPFAITLDVAMEAKTVSLPPTRGRLPFLPRQQPDPITTAWLNGLKVLEALKNDPITRAIPIIICSTQAEEEKGYQMGAADYLLKPILEEELLQAIQRIELMKPAKS